MNVLSCVGWFLDGDGEHNALGENTEGERKSDRSVSNDSTKSDSALDDVAEYDIPWDEIAVGERIGLGINCTLFYVVCYSYIFLFDSATVYRSTFFLSGVP